MESDDPTREDVERALRLVERRMSLDADFSASLRAENFSRARRLADQLRELHQELESILYPDGAES